ncbi:MarR family transcriptional regulator [Salmonella enterica]|nr:MarR family transcriptional regulator [Salmonella enterica]
MLLLKNGIKTGTESIRPKKTRINTKGAFIMLYQNVEYIERCKGLSGCDRSVLDVLLVNMAYGNRVSITQALIAERLDIKQPVVSRSLSKLINNGLVIKCDGAGKTKIYYLNSNLFEKGHDKVINLDERRLQRA